MNTQNLKLIIAALRHPKYWQANQLVSVDDKGIVRFCAVAQAYEALGGKLDVRYKDGPLGFSTITCADKVDEATEVCSLGWRLVGLNTLHTLPEIASILEKDYIS